jgi:hypothetical protein
MFEFLLSHAPAAAQLGSDPFSLIYNALFYVVFIGFMLYGQRIQTMFWQRNIERALRNLEKWAGEGKDRSMKTILDKGKPANNPKSVVDEYMEFFMIEPVDRDPAGVLGRLEHLLDVRKTYSEKIVAKIAPNAGTEERANIEVVLEAAMALNFIYRVVRHYLILGKKTHSLFIIMQLEMQIPLIEKLAESYYKALDAFVKGTPIGDGIGPMVASKMMEGAPKIDVPEEFVRSDINIDGRNVVILKARGPGGRVGKPGLAVSQVVKQYEGKVAGIITIDAALKLEGEKTGEIVQGVGVALGDPGPEKNRIEQVATDYNIPIQAVIVKQAMEEAITYMKKEIVDSVDNAIVRVKEIVNDMAKAGETVIVVGIGNTLGVGQ